MFTIRIGQSLTIGLYLLQLCDTKIAHVWRNYAFKFDEVWTKSEECENIIKAVGVLNQNSLEGCLKSCAEVFGQFSKGYNKSFKNQIKHIRSALSHIYAGPPLRF